MPKSDPEADVIKALDRLLLQSGVEGGEFGSCFFIPCFAYPPTSGECAPPVRGSCPEPVPRPNHQFSRVRYESLLR